MIGKQPNQGQSQIEELVVKGRHANFSGMKKLRGVYKLGKVLPVTYT